MIFPISAVQTAFYGPGTFYDCNSSLFFFHTALMCQSNFVKKKKYKLLYTPRGFLFSLSVLLLRNMWCIKNAPHGDNGQSIKNNSSSRCRPAHNNKKYISFRTAIHIQIQLSANSKTAIYSRIDRNKIRYIKPARVVLFVPEDKFRFITIINCKYVDVDVYSYHNMGNRLGKRIRIDGN